MKIGVVSDTHIAGKNWELPGRMLDQFNKVDLIIHAGDLVSPGVIEQLSLLAPVKAVHGNADPLELQSTLPARLNLELLGYKIGVAHGHKLRGHIMDKLSYLFPEEDIIIFGHTHKALNQKINGQLYFNPGSPTDRRLQAQYSFGIIELSQTIASDIIYFK